MKHHHATRFLLPFLRIHAGFGFMAGSSLLGTRESNSWNAPKITVATSTSSSLLAVPSDVRASSGTDEFDDEIMSKFNMAHPNTQENNTLLTFVLDHFKPLGCTVEESLAVEQDGLKAIFISRVLEDGNAKNVGLEVGDVIVAVSGNFGDDTVDVVGASLESVKGLISGRNEDDGLVLKVVRGSDVMSKHESALIDLCTLPEVDKDIDKCIESLYKADYDLQEDVSSSSSLQDCEDTSSGSECLLDKMFDMWGEETDFQEQKEDVQDRKEETVKKPAPWSSRSSPSGTFVRDPKTGKLVNIDA